MAVHTLFSVCSCESTTSAELSVVVCNPSTVGVLLEGVSTYPALRHVVTWGNPQPEHVLKTAEEYGVTLHSMDEVEVSCGGHLWCENRLPNKLVMTLWMMLCGHNLPNML